MESEENTRLDTLIDGLRQRGVLNDRRVEAAFRAVPRHVFLPGLDLDEVYQDQAIITKRENQVPVSSSSQPAIMAIMLERLMVEPGHNLLEIGTGTGYNAALMAFLAGEHGRVTSVEIDEEIALQARQNLQNLAAVTALTGRLAPIQAHCAEGGLGSTEFAPYDRIILTVGAWDIAPAWLEQLKPGGHLVLPLWFHGTPGCSRCSVRSSPWTGPSSSMFGGKRCFQPLNQMSLNVTPSDESLTSSKAPAIWSASIWVTIRSSK